MFANMLDSINAAATPVESQPSSAPVVEEVQVAASAPAANKAPASTTTSKPATKILPNQLAKTNKATMSKEDSVAAANAQSTGIVDSLLNFNFSRSEVKFFDGKNWDYIDGPKHFVGISGEPVPYKISSDVFVTSTILACFFIACFVISNSMHALKLQIKNFFHNRDRKEDFSLKSEGEVKNQTYVVLMDCFVLSLLFFCYSEFKLIGVFTQTSPYTMLFADMAICASYFAAKYLLFHLFNWTFFDETCRELWFECYNLTIFGKAVTLLPLVLVIVYFNLSPAVYITLLVMIMGAYELLVLFKVKQIFFKKRFGLVLSFLYFCTLELLPLAMLYVALVKTNEYLIV